MISEAANLPVSQEDKNVKEQLAQFNKSRAEKFSQNGKLTKVGT